MSDEVVNVEETENDQAQTDYKALFEEQKRENESIKKAQSGSDRTVSDLQAKVKGLELASLSDKDRKQKLDEEQAKELEQLRSEKKQSDNKAFALEHFAKLGIDPELVKIVNLDSDKDRIIESVYALENVVNEIKDKAVEDYKKDKRPGFTPSAVNTGKTSFTADELAQLSIQNPEQYAALPDNLKKPAPQKPLYRF